MVLIILEIRELKGKRLPRLTATKNHYPVTRHQVEICDLDAAFDQPRHWFSRVNLHRILICGAHHCLRSSPAESINRLWERHHTDRAWRFLRGERRMHNSKVKRIPIARFRLSSRRHGAFQSRRFWQSCIVGNRWLTCSLASSEFSRPSSPQSLPLPHTRHPHAAPRRFPDRSSARARCALPSSPCRRRR